MSDGAAGQVSRSTPGGRAYLELRALAKATDRTSAEYLRLYALEGFLSRLAASARRSSLVLKGGVLLAAYDLRRPTVDIDFAARGQSNTTAELLALVVDIAGTRLPAAEDDGLVFDLETVTAETIREEDAYSGVRVTLEARLATARERFHVDVNVGDPIWPTPNEIVVPRLLGGEIQLLGYPIPMVLAEKTVTAMQRGTASTRWRDFADVYLLTGRHSIDALDARRAIAEVASYRHVELVALREVLDGYGEIGQVRYRRWRDRLQLGDRLPQSFNEVLGAAIAYVDPLIAGDDVRDSLTWDSSTRRWRSR